MLTITRRTKQVTQPNTGISTLLLVMLAMSAVILCCNITGCTSANLSNPVDSSVSTTKTLTRDGGRVSWSPDGRLIAFDRRGRDGYFDIWAMQTDGSDQQCVLNGPAGAHVGNPEWHPSGGYIVYQAQDPDLALPPGPDYLQKYSASPGIGINNNLCITTADGSVSWQLTHVDTRYGVLHPHFSHSGRSLLWSEIASPGTGDMTIKLADFTIENSKPEIHNIRTLTPGNLGFYETHGFSIDDRKILFCGYPGGSHFYGLDLYTLDLTTGYINRMTNNEDWDEHAHYSPDGHRIIWSSSTGIPQKTVTSNAETLANPPKLDLWIMDADGGNKRRLTHVNDPESPDHYGSVIGSGFGDGSWSPDGKKYVVKLRPGRGVETIVLLELGAV